MSPWRWELSWESDAGRTVADGYYNLMFHLISHVFLCIRWPRWPRTTAWRSSTSLSPAHRTRSKASWVSMVSRYDIGYCDGDRNCDMTPTVPFLHGCFSVINPKFGYSRYCRTFSECVFASNTEDSPVGLLSEFAGGDVSSFISASGHAITGSCCTF